MLPSVKSINTAFPGKGAEIRALLERRRKTYDYASVQKLMAECHHKPDYQYRLETALNEIAGTYGAEATFSTDSCTRPAAVYLNTGDTYAATLLYDVDRNRWYVTSWGDWVETAERTRRYRFE